MDPELLQAMQAKVEEDLVHWGAVPSELDIEECRYVGAVVYQLEANPFKNCVVLFYHVQVSDKDGNEYQYFWREGFYSIYVESHDVPAGTGIMTRLSVVEIGKWIVKGDKSPNDLISILQDEGDTITDNTIDESLFLPAV